jgi:hypothetical protein
MPKKWNDSELLGLAEGISKNLGADAIIAIVPTRTIGAVKRVLSDYVQGKDTVIVNRLKFLVAKLDEKAKAKAKPRVKDKTPGAKPLSHNKSWTKARDTELVKLFAMNVQPDEIGRALNRTTYSILGRLHTLGILSFDKNLNTYFTYPVPYYRVAV